MEDDTMSIVKCKNKKSGITYVYESESYWDKEKQQPRAHRKLIGKIDEETGEIVPTGTKKRRQSRERTDESTRIKELCDSYEHMLREKDTIIVSQKEQIQKLAKEKNAILTEMKNVIHKYAQ